MKQNNVEKIFSYIPHAKNIDASDALISMYVMTNDYDFGLLHKINHKTLNKA